jgi:hypothetical protein
MVYFRGRHAPLINLSERGHQRPACREISGGVSPAPRGLSGSSQDIWWVPTLLFRIREPGTAA